MSFRTSNQNGVVVVDEDGQLIVGNRQELKQKVLDELEGGERKFLIDFTNTGYIDSSGLGVLVSLSKKIREQGGELRLANLNEDLRTLFELTKLDTLFYIADSRDDALAPYSAGPGRCTAPGHDWRPPPGGRTARRTRRHPVAPHGALRPGRRPPRPP
jgi:anti-sigma B factor antagonist